MKKILLSLLFLATTMVFAEVTNRPVTIPFVNEKDMKIIDIRTEGEWREMGIVSDAYLLTFFDERYGYDTEAFLKELNHIVKKDEQFALICNTGSRTKLVSNFLSKNGYNVVNLTGGMSALARDGYKPKPYKQSRDSNKDNNSSE